MTVEDRCTATNPHPAHRTQYGPFGVKDCPGVPITPKNAPTVPDGPAPASTPPPRRGEFCHVHYSWLCQAGQGRCQAGAEHPAAEMVWLGDLSGYTLEPDDDGVVVRHRCGWTYELTQEVMGYLANLLDGPVAAHRRAGCVPREQPDPPVG